MKKPAPLGLLANKQEIKNYAEEYAEYIKFIIGLVQKESGLSDPLDLIVYLVEKYHYTLRIKPKRGAKIIWDDQLNAMVATEIDQLKRSGCNRKQAIERLIEDPTWEAMLKKSKEPFDLLSKAEKAAKKKDKHKKYINKYYLVMPKVYGYHVLNETLDEWKKEIKLKIKDALKKD